MEGSKHGKTTRSPSVTSPADTRCVRLTYDLHKAIQCLSIHSSQKVVVFGCNAELKVVNVNIYSDRLTITERGSISTQALGSADGGHQHISITDIEFNPFDTNKLAVVNSLGDARVYNLTDRPQALVPVWFINNFDSYLTKTTWQNSHILATASSTGHTRLFDTRPAKSLTATFKKGQTKSATRDIKFHRSQPEIFAEVSEDGSLKIWDIRYGAAPFMYLAAAHNKKICSVDWSIYNEYHFATASIDKTVQIWDAGACSLSTDPHKSYGPESVQPVKLETIRAPHELGKVMWTTFGNNEFLATRGQMSGQESNGHIYLWEPSNPDIPVCIMRGQGTELCSDFGIIDLPLPFGRCFITGSKDGHVFVQDPQLGYFPYKHLSPTVPAISSQGHVAFHRGDVGKVSSELTSTASSPSLPAYIHKQFSKIPTSLIYE